MNARHRRWRVWSKMILQTTACIVLVAYIAGACLVVLGYLQQLLGARGADNLIWWGSLPFILAWALGSTLSEETWKIISGVFIVICVATSASRIEALYKAREARIAARHDELVARHEELVRDLSKLREDLESAIERSAERLEHELDRLAQESERSAERLEHGLDRLAQESERSAERLEHGLDRLAQESERDD